MKRFLLFLIATLSFCNIFAIDQECIVYQYNGMKPRTPLGGVYVKVAISEYWAVSQERTGRLTLKLQNCRLGDAIGKVVVQKEGMMIFNKDEVDRWSVRKEPLVLILCDANEFQKRKEQLIAIGCDLADKKYKQKKEQLKALNVKQQLSIDQYCAKSDSIDNKKRNTLAHMDEYADMLARIDESELDSLAQRGIELFNQGKFEEAIRLFEQGNYLEKLEDALMVKAQTEGMCQKLDTAQMVANKDIEEYTKSVQTQVEVYKVKKEWAKAGELLKGLADKLQTLDVIMDYADFALSLKQYNEAEVYLKLYLYKIKSSDQQNEIALAKGYYKFAVLFCNICRFNESEQLYKSALEIFKRFVDTNPQTYKSDLANCNIGLAHVSILTKQFTKAEEYSNEALKVDSTDNFAYINLAAAYLLQGKYNEAEKIYLQYKSELKDNFQKDLEEFSKAGVIPTDRKKDVKKIKKILE